MVRLLLIIFLCIYATFNVTVTAVSIDEFNTLVQYPAWKSLTHNVYGNQLKFIGLNLNNIPQMFTLQTLFPNNSSTNIVTEQNFSDRVWQFHLLLSVYYAIDLKPLIKLIINFWDICQDPNNWMLKKSCQDSFIKKYLVLYIEIKKMLGSLLYYSKMVNLNEVNSIHNTLNILIEIKENVELKEDDITTKLQLAEYTLDAFLEINAYSVSTTIIEENLLVVTNFISNINSLKPVQEKILAIEEKINTNILNLAQNNRNYGFQYNQNTLAVSLSTPIIDNWADSLENLSI